MSLIRIPKPELSKSNLVLTGILATKHDGDFDYSALAKDASDKARRSAQAIRSRIEDTRKNLILIGEELRAIKALLAHGQFGAWVKSEFNWSQRTAENYMAVAEKLGAFKIETVSILPAVTQYKLAAAPEPVQKAVVAKLEIGELTPKAVKGFIAEHQSHAGKSKIKIPGPANGITKPQQSEPLDQVSPAPAVVFLKSMLPLTDLKHLLTLLKGVSGESFLALLRVDVKDGG